MRGRPPKPRSLRVLEGNPGKRPLPDEFPTVTPGRVPPAPDYLDDVGKAEWKRAAKALIAASALATTDLSALVAYCQAFSRWRQAERELTQAGSLTVNANGVPRLHPLVAECRLALEAFLRASTEFGLTPSSRTRVKAAKAQPSDDLEALLA